LDSQRQKLYKGLFLTAAVYDLVLGIVFLFFARQAFGLLGAENALPEHGGFVWLIGAFLFVIGIGYWLIYRGDLQRNRDLIAIGSLYKLAYVAVALFTLAVGEYPHLSFVLIFGTADLVFFVLMTECWAFLGRKSAQPAMAF
jgi:hypothetical protein